MTTSSAHAPVAETVEIRAGSGWVPIDLPELWRYRELIGFLALRDVKVRYKQSLLGAAWAVLQPLLTMVVFSVLFGLLGSNWFAIGVLCIVGLLAPLLVLLTFPETAGRTLEEIAPETDLRDPR